MILCSFRNLNLSFGSKVLFENAELVINKGDRIGLLGLNGKGKSSLFKILEGKLSADHSTPPFTFDKNESYSYFHVPQDMPTAIPHTRTIENVFWDFYPKEKNLVDELDRVNEEYSQRPEDQALQKKQEKLLMELDHRNPWAIEQNFQSYCKSLGLLELGQQLGELSGGQKKKILLALGLSAEESLILYDEPTNHLDAESVAWLQRFLGDYSGMVVMITHDRYFLDNVTGWILEIDRTRGIPYEGNYSAYLEAKMKRMAQESREEDARQKVLKREQEWMGKSPSARRAKSKARISAYNDLLEESQDVDTRATQIVIPTPPRLGDLVIEAKNIKKAFGDKLLIDGLSFRLPPGGIVGVIGPNGAGKTTLFKMITGNEQPDEGEFNVGDTVKLGYVDQSRDALDGGKTVWEEISGGTDIIKLGKIEMQSRAYVSAFNFRKGDQQQLVKDLSGGQRNRVHLAKMLKEEANVILLDEPTNDLDTETLAALEEAIERFPGCVVIISHDRWFLDRLCTHILAFEGNSHVEWFEGNYQDYEADYKRRMGIGEDESPTRIKYKPLRKAG